MILKVKRLPRNRFLVAAVRAGVVDALYDHDTDSIDVAYVQRHLYNPIRYRAYVRTLLKQTLNEIRREWESYDRK